MIFSPFLWRSLFAFDLFCQASSFNVAIGIMGKIAIYFAT